MIDDETLHAMVENGMGISILPEMVLHRVPTNVRTLKLEGENYRTIGIASASFLKYKMNLSSNRNIKQVPNNHLFKKSLILITLQKKSSQLQSF